MTRKSSSHSTARGRVYRNVDIWLHDGSSVTMTESDRGLVIRIEPPVLERRPASVITIKREMLAAMLPILTQYAETGELPE